MKPKKCSGCVYLYRHPSANPIKRFRLITQWQYMCNKFGDLHFMAWEECKGQYKEEAEK
jgi:hypothetical protein